MFSLSRCLSLSLATRESAFVHAIASAGVAFAVTRSCAEGTSTMCGCDSHHKGPPGEGWKWGGCSEDAEFGVLISREFADARENRPDARSAMNRHNNEAGRMVRSESKWCWYKWIQCHQKGFQRSYYVDLYHKHTWNHAFRYKAVVFN